MCSDTCCISNTNRNEALSTSKKVEGDHSYGFYEKLLSTQVWDTMAEKKYADKNDKRSQIQKVTDTHWLLTVKVL